MADVWGNSVDGASGDVRRDLSDMRHAISSQIDAEDCRGFGARRYTSESAWSG